MELPRVHFDPQFVASTSVSMTSVQEEIQAIESVSQVEINKNLSLCFNFTLYVYTVKNFPLILRYNTGSCGCQTSTVKKTATVKCNGYGHRKIKGTVYRINNGQLL